MKKIGIRVEPNWAAFNFNPTTVELGYSEFDWEKLTEYEKEQAVEIFIEEHPEQPCWVIDTFQTD